MAVKNLHLEHLEDEIINNLIEEYKKLSLLPLEQLIIHEIVDGSAVGALSDDLKGQIDIAIIPDLFSKNVIPKEQTQVSSKGSGGFNPLWDNPTELVEGLQGYAVLNLIPVTPDPIFWDWSTLNVWAKRQSSVSDSSENIDYFQIDVQYETVHEDFKNLHDYAHWVITLDQFVSQAQIDAMEANIEVIHLQEKLGKDNIIKEFLRRGGLRCEILNSGTVVVGDSIKVL